MLASSSTYGLGVGWAQLYVLLRRWWRMPAPQAGIVTGVALFAIVDEGLNPIIGSSAPPQAYPLSTHVRGLVGHLVYGLALAAAVEGASLLLRQGPAPLTEMDQPARAGRNTVWATSRRRPPPLTRRGTDQES